MHHPYTNPCISQLPVNQNPNPTPAVEFGTGLQLLLLEVKAFNPITSNAKANLSARKILLKILAGRNLLKFQLKEITPRKVKDLVRNK